MLENQNQIDKSQVPGSPSREDISTGKRSLLKAAWVAPAVIAISLPLSSFMANASSGHGGDKDHDDKDHDKDHKKCKPKNGGIISTIIDKLKGCD